MTQTTTAELAAKFKELFQEYEQAVSLAGTMLRAYGMDSPQFHDANKTAGLLWLQLQELRNTSGIEWMK